MHKLLLTGAGAPGGPGIIKALQESGQFLLVVADADYNAAGRFLNPLFEVIPKADDPSFIAELKRICDKYEIEVVLPLVTKELFSLAKAKCVFATQNIKIIVSNHEELQLANDKSKLYHHLRKHQITVPDFYVVKTVEDFVAAATKLGYPEKPFCFKPSVGNGSRGFRIVSDAIDASDLLFNHKPNNTYIGYDQALSILTKQSFPELLVSEYLPGEEFSVDTIIKEGEPQLILPRHRTAMREGISIRGEFVNHQGIINYCKEILKCLPLHGPVGIQVKQAVDGSYKILEINPRIQGTSTAALGMGINLPQLSVLQEFGPIALMQPSNILWGTQFIRYYSEVFPPFQPTNS